MAATSFGCSALSGRLLLSLLTPVVLLGFVGGGVGIKNAVDVVVGSAMMACEVVDSRIWVTPIVKISSQPPVTATKSVGSSPLRLKPFWSSRVMGPMVVKLLTGW